MSNELNDYIDNNKHDNCWLVKRVEMNDGFNISIQANEFAYCSPRKNALASRYSSFELGYPSDFDDLINGFAEELHTLETVYPYTPRNIIEDLIEKHKGIKGVFIKLENKEE